MPDNYWTHTFTWRLSRRRALATSGAAATGAAIMAACGSGKAGSNAPGGQSGLVSQPVDTTNKAIPGGVWQTSRNSDVTTIDPTTSNSSSNLAEVVPYYSTLLKYGAGTGGKIPATSEISGDAAESWEFAPDGTQITLKLRPNHKFDPRPPTNGRA